MKLYEINSIKSNIKYANISAVHSINDMLNGAEQLFEFGFLEKSKFDIANEIKDEILAKITELNKLINN